MTFVLAVPGGLFLAWNIFAVKHGEDTSRLTLYVLAAVLIAGWTAFATVKWLRDHFRDPNNEDNVEARKERGKARVLTPDQIADPMTLFAKTEKVPKASITTLIPEYELRDRVSNVQGFHEFIAAVTNTAKSFFQKQPQERGFLLQ